MLQYPQFPRLADIGGNALNAFNTAFDGARDRRFERDATPAFGRYLDGMQQQPMSLSALAPQGTPVGQVQRQPLPGNDYASGRVALAHGGPAMQSLIQNESGGNWQAQNNARGAGGQRGHYGRLQFGHARLADAMRAGVIPQGMSPQAFMASPEAQMAVENWHFSDIDQEAQRRGLTAYVGQNIGGATITPEGIRAMAHLGGIQGAERYLKSGGRYNPADANGTRLSDYAQRHGGQGGQAPAQAALESLAVGEALPMQQPQQVAQMGGGMPMQAQQPMQMPDRETMLELFRNPVTRPLAIELAQANIQHQQNQNDPMRQLELQKALLEVEQLRNPRPETTSGIREYEYARQQGYQGSFEQFQQEQRRAGASQTNVNIPGQANIGTIPQGWAATQDESGNWSMSPIPGGPAEQEILDAERVRSGQQELTQRQLYPAIDEITTARDLATSGWGTTGQFSGIAQSIPWLGQDSINMAGTIASIGSSISLENLNQMRQNSPTGGALGNVSNQQMVLLSEAFGALRQSMSRDLFLYNLARVENTLNDIIHGEGNGPERHDMLSMRSQLRGEPEQSGPRRIETEQDYLNLPSGAEFVAPDGSIRRKP